MWANNAVCKIGFLDLFNEMFTSHQGRYMTDQQFDNIIASVVEVMLK